MKNKTISRSFREILGVSKPLFFWNYGLTLLQGITNALPIIALQIFFDQVVALTEGTGKWWVLVLSLAGFVLIQCIGHVMKALTNYSYEYYDMLAAKFMTDKLNRKVSRWQAWKFEDKQNLEHITKAYQGTGGMRRVVDTILMIGLYYVPEILVVVFYLYQANPFLPLAILIIVITVVVAEKVQEQFYVDLEEQTAPLGRKAAAYAGYITNLQHYKETKLLHMQDDFARRTEGAIQARNAKRWECFCKSLKYQLLEKGIVFLGHIAIIAVLFLCVFRASITVGTFAALLTSLSGLFDMVESLVGEISGGITQTLSKVRNYFRVQNSTSLPRGEAVPGDFQSICLKNVSFSYPNADRPALEDVSLEIRKGEHIAIVGENGSGKTTLIKVLSGLYPPQRGTVLYNDRPYDQFREEELHRGMSAVFQNYGRYKLSVAENVKISDTTSNEDIGPCLKEADFQLLKKDELTTDQILAREFGGVDLSTGQWQRLAISRGFYRKSDLIFLDEPTASIDPLEEGRLFAGFHRLTAGKSSIVVTHRLESIRYTDRIWVMKDGRLVGDGTHKNLLDTCEEYQRIWKAQANMLG